MEAESAAAFTGLAIVDRRAENVGRQQITGELDAVEFESERSRQRMRQRGLADTRHILDQQMAARQQAGQAQTDLPVLAEDNVVDLGKGSLKRRIHDDLTRFAALPRKPAC